MPKIKLYFVIEVSCITELYKDKYKFTSGPYGDWGIAKQVKDTYEKEHCSFNSYFTIAEKEFDLDKIL